MIVTEQAHEFSAPIAFSMIFSLVTYRTTNSSGYNGVNLLYARMQTLSKVRITYISNNHNDYYQGIILGA